MTPKLKAAMKEVEAILKKHDLGGSMVLCDGVGSAEFRMFIDTPSWSMIRFVKNGIHIKGYAKSQPVETNMTINMICILQEVTAGMFGTFDGIKKRIKQQFDIEESGGEFIPHEED